LIRSKLLKLILEGSQNMSGTMQLRKSAVLTGVSFLGAGTIIRNQRDGGHVEGLTTAASLLLAAAIGVSVALAQFVVALGLTILILSVLRLLGYVENRFAEQPAPAAPAEEQP
jgi:uncharacterized membrane protein YhiD involved in acid resistance